jgi:hypothetical protein
VNDRNANTFFHIEINKFCFILISCSVSFKLIDSASEIIIVFLRSSHVHVVEGTDFARCAVYINLYFILIFILSAKYVILETCKLTALCLFNVPMHLIGVRQ